MEHIVTSTIMDHLEKKNILCQHQHGFRKERSCKTQLLELIDELINNTEQGKQTDILIMDFSKAFDKVNHRLLLHKLHHYGIQGNINTWIQDFLYQRKQTVVVSGTCFDPINVKFGVPQGSVLGPCLFLLYSYYINYINDLPDNLTTRTRLFADDTAAYNIVTTPEDKKQLQEDLDKLATWEANWEMSFHPAKCTTLPISKSRNPTANTYQLHGHTLLPNI